jgi:serine/threonine protein kinase
LFDHSDPGDAFPFYVMEYIEGARPIKKLVGTSDNPFQGNALRALQFFQQLASAIHAWEQAKIVHRDLSPGNVLILPNGDIKVIDFGICQIDETETITLVDEGVGTPNYMAPECESGAGGSVKTWSDIYSAGKLLWTAITNQFAFAREQAAFNSKALKILLPNDPKAWHLHHIFEKTIRHTPADRVLNAKAAIELANHVEYLIVSQYRPLELLNTHCPLCGFGKLRQSDTSGVFGDRMPSGFIAMLCAYCGFAFPINEHRWSESLRKRKELL